LQKEELQLILLTEILPITNSIRRSFFKKGTTNIAAMNEKKGAFGIAVDDKEDEEERWRVKRMKMTESHCESFVQPRNEKVIHLEMPPLLSITELERYRMTIGEKKRLK